ncbi:MAG: hypothetical protein ACT4OJ_09135 [Bacteroidota bacterium]
MEAPPADYLGMRRVNTRGIKQAGKCMLLAAIAYNLKKLLKWEQRKIQTAAMAMMKGAAKGLQSLIKYIFGTPAPGGWQ